MNAFLRYISSQFKNPKGWGGRLVCYIQNKVNCRMYNRLVGMLDLKTTDKLLDVGFGNGHLLKLIYEKHPVDMFGVDVSADAIAMATSRNGKAAANGQLHLQVADCCDLPFPDDSFSAVTSINTVYFWQDVLKGLSEIRRVLASGKSFYNVAYTPQYLNSISFTQVGYNKLCADQLVQLGKQAGFSRVSVYPLVEGKSFVVIYTK